MKKKKDTSDKTLKEYKFYKSKHMRKKNKK